jgi:hypothetical protein
MASRVAFEPVVEVMRTLKEGPLAKRRRSGVAVCAAATAERTVALQTSWKSRPPAVCRIRKVVAEGRFAHLGQALPDSLEGSVSHMRAGPLAEDEQVSRVARPDHQGGDFSLRRFGNEFHPYVL